MTAAPQLRAIDGGAAYGGRGAAAVQPFQLLTIEDLANRPPISYALDPFIPAGGFAVLFGPSGVGKSFLALDWALCIAAGLPWYGQPVRAGTVVYIVAEGVAGVSARVSAWLKARQQNHVARIRFIPEAANLLDPTQCARVARTLQTLDEPPTLIVWDTMARSMVGGDENAARDVGMAIDAADRIAAPYAAARLFVHHTGKNGEDERGSSSLRGAVDIMHSLKPDGASLRLRCEKVKDAAEYQPWNLHLDPTAESCVLRCGTNPGALATTDLELLTLVSTLFETERVASGALLAASQLPRATFFRTVKRLENRGLLRGEVDGRTKRYSLTDAGAAQLVSTGLNPSQSQPELVSSHGAPLGPVRPETGGTAA
jgi:hypothetical protein